MSYPTPQAALDGMHAKLSAAIRAEKRLLIGWRRRHPHAGPEERQEMERWAEAAKASINNLTERINQLRPPEAKAA